MPGSQLWPYLSTPCGGLDPLPPQMETYRWRLWWVSPPPPTASQEKCPSACEAGAQHPWVSGVVRGASGVARKKTIAAVIGPVLPWLLAPLPGPVHSQSCLELLRSAGCSPQLTKALFHWCLE